MVINRVREGLYDKDIPSPHILIDLHHDLAVTKRTYQGLAQRDLQVPAYFLCQTPVGIPCKHLHLMIRHLHVLTPLLRLKIIPKP